MNEFIARNGIIAQSNSTITGSLTVTNGITGSISGIATSASFAISASQAASAVSSSFASNATSASFAALAATASYFLTSSVSSASFATSASYAATSSFASNFTVTNTLTAQTLVVQTVSSSVVYSSGSNVFGNDLSNTQVMTGSVNITGSFRSIGPMTVSGSAIVTGSLTALSLIKVGGTSTQYLMADGSTSLFPDLSSSIRSEQTYTATANQTTFTVTGGYVVGLVDVYVNGVKYAPADYTATNGTTVVLTEGVVAGDIVDIINYKATIAALPTSRDTFDYTATAGQTSFTVSGGYVVGLLDVYVNGVKLTSSEYTATNGTTFVLTDPSVVGDQVQAIRYNASVNGVSGAGTTNFIPKFTASQTIGDSAISDNGTTVTLNSRTLSGSSAAFTGAVTTSGQLTMAYGGTPRLVVQDTDAGAGNVGILFKESTNDRWAIASVGGALQFFNETTSANAMYITSGSNVGIGTIAPTRKLSIDGGSSTATWTGYQQNGTERLVVGLDASGNPSFYGTQANDAIFYTSNTERMRITSGGNSQYTGDPFIYSNTTAGGTAIHSGLRFHSTDKYIRFFTNDLGRMDITSGGNVLIGTTADSGFKLDVNGTGRFSGALNIGGNQTFTGVAGTTRYIITDETSTGTGRLVIQAGAGSAGFGGAINLYAASHPTYTGDVAIALSATTGAKFRVNSSGLDGGTDLLTILRTGAATFSSSVQTGSSSGGEILKTANAGTNAVFHTFLNTGGTYYIGAEQSGGGNIVTGDGSYDLVLRAPSGITLSANNGASPNMRITSGGNVGIGTTAPFQESANRTVLSVNGTTNAIINLGSAGTLRSYLYADGGGGTYETIGTNTISASGANIVNFLTNGSERMRITSGGTLYLNTTGNPLPDNAVPQLGVLAGANTDAVNIKHTQNGNNTFNLWQTGTTSCNMIAFYKGDTQVNRGLITVTTSGTTYNSVSDYRLKENVTPLQNGIDRLMQLKPSKFNWIETGHESEGFIAHELQEIFPDAVTGEKDAVYNSTGNIKPQSVDYGRITPLLVKALQEQQAQIQTLTARLQELENK
jgi:hypothetical protein